tara:strand:- start:2438 stop:2671 length:234 start_codon:yes stop_codon:yes gene_type:complete
MKVRFLKDHPAGISQGQEVTVRDSIANKWMIEGYIEIVEDIILVDVEKPKTTLATGGVVSNKKQSKRSKSGKGKKRK